MAWTTTTKHTCNHSNGPVFGKKTVGCPRCDELLAGAKPVQGWGAAAREREARVLRAIRNHNCETANCGPVCTAFDW